MHTAWGALMHGHIQAWGWGAHNASSHSSPATPPPIRLLYSLHPPPPGPQTHPAPPSRPLPQRNIHSSCFTSPGRWIPVCSPRPSPCPSYSPTCTISNNFSSCFLFSCFSPQRHLHLLPMATGIQTPPLNLLPCTYTTLHWWLQKWHPLWLRFMEWSFHSPGSAPSLVVCIHCRIVCHLHRPPLPRQTPSSWSFRPLHRFAQRHPGSPNPPQTFTPPIILYSWAPFCPTSSICHSRMGAWSHGYPWQHKSRLFCQVLLSPTLHLWLFWLSRPKS